ncbi:hypothetical protein AX15_005197 [Amanita polypyramis BW_CC]|nr:hypothetical protein AX15_005197 [Amanita polypyramis BW_CC]
MPCTLLFVTLVFTAVPAVSGLATPRGTAPAGWSSNLEPYNIYHHRYMTFKCHEKHNTPFFNECCYPLLATEIPTNALPSQCLNSNPASHPTVSLSSTAIDYENEDCQEMDESLPTQAEPSMTSVHVMSTHVPSQSLIAVTPTSDATTRPSLAHAFGLSKIGLMKRHTDGHGYPSRKSLNSGQVFTGGYATYFYQEGNAGACGQVHSDNDLIAAMDSARYGNEDGRSALCGRKVRITNPSNEKSVVVTIADACPTCRNANSIDLSLGAFEQIAPLSEGIVDITWKFT